MLRTISTLALAGCAAAALNGSALAQDKVTLKFADWMSLSHYTVSEAAIPFRTRSGSCPAATSRSSTSRPSSSARPRMR